MTDGGFDWVLRRSPPRSFLALLLRSALSPAQELKNSASLWWSNLMGYLTMWVLECSPRVDRLYRGRQRLPAAEGGRPDPRGRETSTDG